VGCTWPFETRWIVSIDPSNSSPDLLYRLAEWYGQDAISSSAAAQASDIAQARHYLALGDTSYANALAADASALATAPSNLPPYVNSVLGDGLVLKARTLGALYRANAPNATFDDAANAFNQGIAQLEKSPSDADSIGSALYGRYNFAVFLAGTGASAHLQEIRTVLSPIDTDAETAAFYQSFLKPLPTTSGFKSSLTRQNILQLAAADPKFKAVLIGLGWTATDLQ
jgi:hypothetical protein